MKRLSVYVIAKNEARRIRRTLEAVRPVADEIVVVDSGSTDDTVRIASEIADKVVFREWTTYSDQKHYAQELCMNDWVMMDDADEVVSPGLLEELKRWKAQPDEAPFVYRFNIVSVYPGEGTPRAFADSYDEIRLYHRGHADMRAGDLTNDRVTPRPGEPVGRFGNRIWHYSYLSLEQVVAKHNKYSTEVLEKCRATGRHFSRIRLFTEFPLNFVRYYFIRRQFVHGWLGFLVAFQSAYARWLRIAKDVEGRVVGRGMALPVDLI